MAIVLGADQAGKRLKDLIKVYLEDKGLYGRYHVGNVDAESFGLCQYDCLCARLPRTAEVSPPMLIRPAFFFLLPII